jgi:predicted nicotinamide N-methyase
MPAAAPLPLALQRPPACPELALWLVAPGVDLDVDARAYADGGPPYWAFAWASGQALARLLIDEPARARGRRVADLGAGSGIAAIAAARAGAAHVVACDVDPLARAAAARNARANGVALEIAASLEDALASAPELLLAADVCYEPDVAERLAALAARGGDGPEILLADPARRGLPLPLARLEPVARLRARTFPDVGEPTPGADVHRVLAAAAPLLASPRASGGRA